MASGQKIPAPKTVLLLNFGGPRNLDEVAGFITEILRDPNTIQIPAPQWVQNLLARFITWRRVREVRRQYGEIGGRSPIVASTESLVSALAGRLVQSGHRALVLPVHRYLPGQVREAMETLMASDSDDVLALPLYPHFSYATSGSGFQQIQAALAAAGFTGRVRGLRSYPDEPGYLDALAERLQACLDTVRDSPAETVILCSAHGLPAAYVAQGDPYRLELFRSLEGLRRRFSQWRFVLSFQSRVGPAQWLQPYTERIVPQLAAEGVRSVVFLPLSFVNDHIETLYEIGVTYFNVARAHGMTPYRVEAIESHPAYVEALAGMVRHWMRGHAGVPLEDLLPREQFFMRHDRWALTVWLALFITALLFAVR